MRIINPSYGIEPLSREKVVQGAVNWRTDAIALFSNSKPNAKELLDGLKAKFGSMRSIDNIEYLTKDTASRPAPPEMIDQVSKKYRAALLALGD